MSLGRDLKNIVVSRKILFDGALNLVNAPIIGRVYDSIYFPYLKRKIKGMKYTIAIEPNNICNLRCEMCPYQRMKRAKTTMAMPLFKKVVKQAKELGVETIMLSQYNEAFSDKEIFERFQFVRDSKLKSLIYSNGTLLNEEMRKKILKTPPDILRFSVDGVKKETFESIRKGANFEKVVGNIISLYNERNKAGLKLPAIEVYFTILEKNRKEAKPFLKFWKNKCDFASVYPADSRQDAGLALWKFKGKKFYPCFNPKNIIVFSNGKIALCCADIDGVAALGDVNKNTLKEIVNSEGYKKIFAAQLSGKAYPNFCRQCSKGYIDQAFYWWFY
jgi:MoaA/NifB/PqqE/SkfB family radical SAM enzyme